MATQWIDVADDAVKIGLGAAIAGIVAVLTPIIVFAKETFADRRSRRLKMIEEALFCFNTFADGYRTYMAARCDVKRIKFLNINDPHAISRYEAAQKKFDDYFTSLNRAISMLELLGQTELCDKMISYKTRGVEFLNALSKCQNADQVLLSFEELKAELRPLEKSIHNTFGELYNQEPELHNIFKQKFWSKD